MKFPICKKCKSEMRDASALMIGVRFKCPKDCTRIFDWNWDEIKMKENKNGVTIKKWEN